ncbi:MAG: OmpH family outer membrane protein [Gemmataceae bacterium]
MKRTVLLAAGALTLGLAIHVSTLLAQSTSPATATTSSAKSRIAMINLTYVVKNYTKFKTYQEELKKTVDPFQTKDNGLKAQGEKLAKEAQTASAERRDQIERQLKELQRQMEDNKNDAQKVVIKKQEDQLKTLYMDVRSVVERYAAAHGYEMVLHYNDATTSEEYWSPQNIARKMQAGALVPMYMGTGIDISANIVSTLNSSFGSGGSAGGAASGTTR